MRLYLGYLLLVASLCVQGNTEPQSIHEYSNDLPDNFIPPIGEPPPPMQGILSMDEYLKEFLYKTLAPSGRPLLGDIRMPPPVEPPVEMKRLLT